VSVSLSKIYNEGLKEAISYYYIHDFAIRSPRFMTIPEPDLRLLVRPLGEYSVYLGETVRGKTKFYWDPSIIKNPLIAIIGMPGAGKSETVKTLIYRFKRKRPDVPVIVVDPEGEYEEVVRQLGEGVVLNIGTDHYINIFDRPSWDFNYQLWVRKTVIPGIIKALKVSEAQAPLMISVLEEAIFNVYEKKLKFNPANKETWKQEDPTLRDIVLQLESMKRTLKESKKEGYKLRAVLSLEQRLKRWTERQGSDFFAYKSTIKLSDLLKQPLTVFNIKSLPDDAKDVFTYYIFQYFYSLMEMSKPLASFGIRLLLVFDEGWILLKRTRHSESPLAPLFRRARKYGFASIIATQQYKDISEDILPLVGTVMVLQIRDDEAVRKLAKTLKLPDRITAEIPSLPQGRAVVSIAWIKTNYENANTPFMVDIETAMERRVPVIFYKTVSLEETLKALRAQASLMESS
jgi:DNA helicase HerA-like ATPase